MRAVGHKLSDNEASTKFFFELTPDRILAAVEAYALRASGRIVPLNSLENRVFEVEIEVDHNQIKSRYEAFRVVKFYRPGRWSKEQILEEHAFLYELEQADLPVVPPVRHEDGSSLKELESLGIYYAVFPKIGGRILDELTRPQLERLGRLIARLHNVASVSSFKHRLALTVTSYGRDNLRFLEERFGASGDVKRLSSIGSRLCDLIDPWFKVTPTQRLHGDFHLGNVLWNGDILTVVDFDDAVSGPAIQDLWLMVPGRDEESLKMRECMLDAYASMRSFNRETVRLVEPLRALRMIHFSAWIAKRYEDPAFKRAFPDFGSERYWREQMLAVDEVLQILHGAHGA